MRTEFWQTEKDFNVFIKVVDEVGAELYSYRGEKYNGLPFNEIYTTSYQSMKIFYKGADVPIEGNERYRWISSIAECIPFDVPVITNNKVWNGGIYLSKRYDKTTGTYLPHSEEYKTLFKKLSRYIKKNYKLSKDKFAYAGPDFLNEWKNGRLLACNGYPREFDCYRGEFDIDQ